ncbi:hypothetical protein [Klebsiella quasipneumoniae]|uniref:hypothetical protein n=1 Tax=Klebsiella quasipneumoniae TaxID=1463165 RepID=UPI001D10FA84
MSEFSRETLLNIIETDHVQCGDASALARMALAAMDSEPVAENIRIANALEGLLWPNMALGNKAVIQEAIESLRTYHAQPAPVVPAVSDDIGEIRVGRLPTMNQDDYPGLGDWWVQLRIGEDSDEVLARVYGATPQEANNRAEALACRAAMLQELKKVQELKQPAGVTKMRRC